MRKGTLQAEDCPNKEAGMVTEAPPVPPNFEAKPTDNWEVGRMSVGHY